MTASHLRQDGGELIRDIPPRGATGAGRLHIGHLPIRHRTSGEDVAAFRRHALGLVRGQSVAETQMLEASSVHCDPVPGIKRDPRALQA